MKTKGKIDDITPRLLSRREMARYLGVGYDTLKKIHIRGIRITSRRIAYDIRDIDAWIEKMKEAPEGNEAEL